MKKKKNKKQIKGAANNSIAIIEELIYCIEQIKFTADNYKYDLLIEMIDVYSRRAKEAVRGADNG